MNDRRHMAKDMTDAERRISNLAIMGQVAELDAAKARVRVKAGPILTGWLPFATGRAGEDRTWHAPESGEQVLVVAPCGDLNQGVVVGSVYRTAYQAPADSADISRTVYKDGAVQEYDRAGHKWLLDVPSGGRIRLRIGQTTLELRDDGTTLTTPALVVDSPDSTFTGTVLIQKLLTYLAGLVGRNSGGGSSTAQIEGDIRVVSGDVTADAISLKGHTHIEQGDGAPTSTAR